MPPLIPPSTDHSAPPSSCLGCRLTGGVTLLLIAGVVGSARTTAKSSAHRTLLSVLTAGLGWLSVAKVLDLPPFRQRYQRSDPSQGSF